FEPAPDRRDRDRHEQPTEQRGEQPDPGGGAARIDRERIQGEEDEEIHRHEQHTGEEVREREGRDHRGGVHGFTCSPDHRDGHSDRRGEVDGRADDRGDGAGGVGAEQALRAEQEELDVPGLGREQDGREPERDEGEGGYPDVGEEPGARRGEAGPGGRGGGAGRANEVPDRVSCTGGAAGAMSSGELFRTEPTARETGYQLSSGPGAARISSTAAGSVRAGSS